MPEALNPKYQFTVTCLYLQGIEGDIMFYQNYARAVCEMLANTRVENAGFIIATFGDGGIGKSPVLRMVRDMVASKKSFWGIRFFKNFWKLAQWERKKDITRPRRLLQVIRRQRRFKPLVLFFHEGI